MTFPGRQFNGGQYNFKTKGGDGTAADAVPVHALETSDIIPGWIPGLVSATTEIVAATTGKTIEIVSIVSSADASLRLRLESWDGSAATPIGSSFLVTAPKDFTYSGVIGSFIAKSEVSQSVRLALVSGTGNFTGWVQYRLV
jgi:hypothetical protein